MTTHSQAQGGTRRLRATIIGLGLDGQVQGPHRIINGEECLTVGGSAETHADLLETMLRLEGELERIGRTLGEVEPAELADIAWRIDSPELHEIAMRIDAGPEGQRTDLPRDLCRGIDRTGRRPRGLSNSEPVRAIAGGGRDFDLARPYCMIAIGDRATGLPFGDSAMSRTCRPRQRFTILDGMALIAGLAVGIWLLVPTISNPPPGALWERLFLYATYLLGGLCLAGPPLLILERVRGGRPWFAGKLLWFSQGMASWLLFPPIVYYRGNKDNNMGSGSAGTICFAYGTPLMAVYMVAGLIAGGWLRMGRRRAIRRSFRESFGLLMGLAWACLGLYVLSMIYRDKFR